MSTITSARFTDAGSGIIAAVVAGETVFVPDRADNPLRCALAAWEAEGGVIAAAASFDPVAPAVSNFQARAALIEAGLFATVDAAIRDSGDAIAVQAWEYANEVHRDGALVGAFARRLGLTDAAVDALFRRAAAIAA